MDPARILPDGCIDLVWTGAALQVAGPDTGARLFRGPPGTTWFGVRFVPGAAPPVLGVPAAALRDRTVELTDVWAPARVGPLEEALAAAPDADRAAGILEAELARRSAAASRPDPAVSAAAWSLAGGRDVAATAELVGIGERQLHRRCLAAVGYGPKTLQRVLRFRHALGLARGGAPFADLAITAGYADQSHLANEVRALAGVPLGVLVPR